MAQPSSPSAALPPPPEPGTRAEWLPDVAATRAAAHRLASLLPPQAVVLLHGPVGAGKSTFVQGLAEAWGIAPENVTSPTFSLVQTYRGERLLVHVDAYRLAGPDAFDSLMLEEALVGPVWCLAIEWPEQLGPTLPFPAPWQIWLSPAPELRAGRCLEIVKPSPEA